MVMMVQDFMFHLWLLRAETLVKFPSLFLGHKEETWFLDDCEEVKYLKNIKFFLKYFNQRMMLYFIKSLQNEFCYNGDTD